MTWNENSFVMNKDDNSISNDDSIHVAVVTHFDTQKSSVEWASTERQWHLPWQLDRRKFLLERQFGSLLHSKDSTNSGGTIFASPLRLARADKAAPPVGAFAVVLARKWRTKIAFFWTSSDATIVVNLRNSNGMMYVIDALNQGSQTQNHVRDALRGKEAGCSYGRKKSRKHFPDVLHFILIPLIEGLIKN